MLKYENIKIYSFPKTSNVCMCVYMCINVYIFYIFIFIDIYY